MKPLVTPIKRFGYLAIWLIILTACRPRTVLSPKQMENLLFDMHTTEGILQEAGYNYGHDEDYNAYMLVVLEQHHTTQAQFDSSLIWYTAHPSIFDKIYPKVMERLQAQFDAYSLLLDDFNNRPCKTVEDWNWFCQHGYKFELMEEKEKKTAQKFAYVKKML